MLGRAAVAMWWDAAPEIRDEIEDWHTHEHMPERVSIPGFLRGTRWRALSGESSYFILYEVARIAVLTGPDYMARLNDPTPWSRKMMPHHLNMVRSLCRVQASAGGLVGGVLATLRFSPLRRGGTKIARWLADEALPAVSTRRGIVGACLLHAQGAAPRTTEQQIRGQDGTADRILLVSGHDAHAVEALVDDMRRALAERKAEVNPSRALYAPAYSLAAKDLQA